jgi:hypothetical protein
VRQDLRADLGLFDEREDPHGSGTTRANHRVHLVDLLDEARPGALRGGGGDFADFSMVSGVSHSPWAFRRFPR